MATQNEKRMDADKANPRTVDPAGAPEKNTVNMDAFMTSAKKIAKKHQAAFVELAK